MIPPMDGDVKDGRNGTQDITKYYKITGKIPLFLKIFEAYVAFIRKFLYNINILQG